MNTANLQLEGLLLTIASINRALVAKGLLSTQEVDQALATSEQTALHDDRGVQNLSPANRDAIAFPARVLRLANNSDHSVPMPSFAELARLVGQTKG